MHDKTAGSLFIGHNRSSTPTNKKSSSSPKLRRASQGSTYVEYDHLCRSAIGGYARTFAFYVFEYRVELSVGHSDTVCVGSVTEAPTNGKGFTRQLALVLPWQRSSFCFVLEYVCSHSNGAAHTGKDGKSGNSKSDSETLALLRQLSQGISAAMALLVVVHV